MGNESGFDFDEDTKTSMNLVAESTVTISAPAAAETTAGPQKEDVLASEDVLDQPLPPGQLTASGEAGATGAAAAEAEKPPEKIYSQADLDEKLRACEARFQRDIDFHKKQACENKNDADDVRKRYDESCKFHRRKESLIFRVYQQLGDGSPSKMYDMVVKYVEAQLGLDEKAELENKLTEVERVNKQLSQDYANASGKIVELDAEVRELKPKLEDTQTQLSNKEKELQKANDELESWHGIGNRMLRAIVPSCLTNKDWFVEFLSKLQDQVFVDPPSDAAILVLASLSEFAVMERSPATACFDWKKQLSDIGLVVANYMHQMRFPESDVISMLRDFSAALCDSPTIKDLKIELFIPSLGPSFNSDRVKHRKGGASVGRIINWGILDSNGPYAKAIVE